MSKPSNEDELLNYEEYEDTYIQTMMIHKSGEENVNLE